MKINIQTSSYQLHFATHNNSGHVPPWSAHAPQCSAHMRCEVMPMCRIGPFALQLGPSIISRWGPHLALESNMYHWNRWVLSYCQGKIVGFFISSEVRFVIGVVVVAVVVLVIDVVLIPVHFTIGYFVLCLLVANPGVYCNKIYKSSGCMSINAPSKNSRIKMNHVSLGRFTKSSSFNNKYKVPTPHISTLYGR